MSKILNPTFSIISFPGANQNNAEVSQALPLNRRTSVYGFSVDTTGSTFVTFEFYTGGDKNTGTKILDFRKVYIHGDDENLQYLFPRPMLFEEGVYIFIDADGDRIATNVDNRPGGFLLYYE